MEYGGKQSKDLGLSPAVYCKSTDEHHSNTHWSDWSCNEPPQELRWFEKSTREPYREPGFVQARGTPKPPVSQKSIRTVHLRAGRFSLKTLPWNTLCPVCVSRRSRF